MSPQRDVKCALVMVGYKIVMFEKMCEGLGLDLYSQQESMKVQ